MPTQSLTTIQKTQLYNELLHTLGDFDKANNLLLTTDEVESLVSEFRLFLNMYISGYKKEVKEKSPANAD